MSIDNKDNKFTGTAIVPCNKCVFFVWEERGMRQDAISQKLGFCRLDPPTVVVVENQPKTVLPIVRPERDGCGQGELAVS